MMAFAEVAKGMCKFQTENIDLMQNSVNDYMVLEENIYCSLWSLQWKDKNGLYSGYICLYICVELGLYVLIYQCLALSVCLV